MTYQRSLDFTAHFSYKLNFFIKKIRIYTFLQDFKKIKGYCKNTVLSKTIFTLNKTNFYEFSPFLWNNGRILYKHYHGAL